MHAELTIYYLVICFFFPVNFVFFNVKIKVGGFKKVMCAITAHKTATFAHLFHFIHFSVGGRVNPVVGVHTDRCFFSLKTPFTFNLVVVVRQLSDTV